MPQKFDLIVLGGGPGGYVAAIRAAQLGLKTAVVESTHLGGVCLNWGCIPTKSLLKSSEVLRTIQQAKEFGIDVTINNVSLQKMVDRSRKISEKLTLGIEALLKKNKITYIKGYGRFKNPSTVIVQKNDQSTEEFISDKIIIATGAKAKELANLKATGERIWLARHAMTPIFLPKNLLIIGSGAIGIEFASFYQALGTKVTVVEILDSILPQEDKEISNLAQKEFEKQGIEFLLKTSVESLQENKQSVIAKIKNNNEQSVEKIYDAAILAIGIVGNTENIGLENINITPFKNQIKTNGYCQTDIPSIYAIGDVTEGPWLAHKASHEGIIAAEHCAGHLPHTLNKQMIPACTYSYPQIASVGLTEEKAKELNISIKIGRFPFKANGKALTLGKEEGLIKTIFDAKTGELLGAHMIGTDVTELIQGFAIAQNLESTEEELMHTVFPHPTLSEMMHESTLNAFQKTIHF